MGNLSYDITPNGPSLGCWRTMPLGGIRRFLVARLPLPQAGQPRHQVGHGSLLPQEEAGQVVL